MSLSRLSRSKNLCTCFSNTFLHSPSVSRNGVEAAQKRCYNAGAKNDRYGKYLGFQSPGLMPGHGFRRFSVRRNQIIERPSTWLNSGRHYATQAATEEKSKKMLFYLTGLVFAMVGLSYAAVPLYRRFCQATGYGGTIQRKESVEEKIARHAKDGTVTTREVVVQFNADVSDGMPWKFIPTQREVRIKPGESALAFYTAENKSSTPITGMSTYNVTPMKAGIYFNKIQCFCFEEQRLLPGETINMPVFFYIDPEFETDPRMDGINNLILSYTFFKVSEE